MVGINIDMPKACTSVQETLGDIEISNCPLYNVCKYRDTIKNNYKPSNCPLVEVEEHNVGHWIQVGKDKCMCDQCDKTFLIAVYPMSGDKNYCPNCGAKMRGKE